MAGEREARAELCVALRLPDKVTMVACNQAANEIEDLADRVYRLEAFITDVATHGLRADMHPTIRMSDGLPVYVKLCEYFSDAETNLRNRCKEVLRNGNG